LKLRKTSWGLIAGLVVVVGLPLLGHWSRRSAEQVCALDGVKIDPAYRVEAIDGSGGVHAFCCPRCARIWLSRQPDALYVVRVTDEVSGERIDSSQAWYVRSSVATSPVGGNRVHVFRTREDAERLARTYGGTVLSDSERPFH
jgi:hypothetical protein